DFSHDFAGLRLLTQHFAVYCHCRRRRPAEELYRLECKVQVKLVVLRTDLVSLCKAKQWISESPTQTASPLLNDAAKNIAESPASGNDGSLPNDVPNDDEKKEEEEEEEEVVKEEYWSCGLCKVVVSSEVTFNKHLEGKKHKRKEAAVVKKQDNPEGIIGAVSEYQKKFMFWCEACEVGTHSRDVMSKHTGGKRHVSRMKELVAQPWL
ncbi:unnamed protein product, partial [Linum tenue]